MESFRDMLARDIRGVFLNVAEFGDLRTVLYDGERYEDIPVVLDEPEQAARRQLTDDHAQGLYRVSDILFCALEDIGGVLPEKGTILRINDTEGGGGFFRRYYVATSTAKNGMCEIELEAIDE